MLSVAFHFHGGASGSVIGKKLNIVVSDVGKKRNKYGPALTKLSNTYWQRVLSISFRYITSLCRNMFA